MTTSFTWENVDALPLLKQLGGLAFLRQVMNGELPNVPIGDTLGFRFVEVESGRVVVAGLADESHYNLIQTVHGGIAATLLDTAMACCILAALPVGQGFTTLELKVNYVRPITAETGKVRAEGCIINVGRTVATSEGRLVDSAGKLLAHGSTTCMIMTL